MALLLWDLETFFGISLHCQKSRNKSPLPQLSSSSSSLFINLYVCLLLIRHSLGALTSAIFPAAHLPCMIFFSLFYFCLSLCPICGSFLPRAVMYVRAAAVHTTSVAKLSHEETSQVRWCRLQSVIQRQDWAWLCTCLSFYIHDFHIDMCWFVPFVFTSKRRFVRLPFT